jgi:hypothetical protein
MNSDDKKPKKPSRDTRNDASRESVEDLIRRIGDEAMRKTIEWAKSKRRFSTNSTAQATEPENEAENDAADSTRDL